MENALKINKELNIEILNGVYKPSDDTFLLLRTIELEGKEKVLEIGCGTGFISLHCKDLGCQVVAVDKNYDAVKNTKINSKKNELRLDVRKSDLFSAVDETDWDVMIFNPPYLPQKENLQQDDRWDGGKKGYETIDRFLKDAKKYLKEKGKIYICFSSLAENNMINRMKKRYKIISKSKEEFFFETLYAVELKPD